MIAHVLGTEILANEKYIGPKADIWSLGVIIFTILTGDMPFKDDNVLTNLKKIEAADYELPEFLSPSTVMSSTVHDISNFMNCL